MIILLILYLLFLLIYLVFNIYGIYRVMTMRIKGDATGLAILFYIISILTVIVLTVTLALKLSWPTKIGTIL